MWKWKYWCWQLPTPRHKEHSSGKHCSSLSHLRQILHLISQVKTSWWHSIVQGDGKAVSPLQQNTAVSADDTTNANQRASRTATCLLSVDFFDPLVHRDHLLLQKELVNCARRCPSWAERGSVQCWAVQPAQAPARAAGKQHPAAQSKWLQGNNVSSNQGRVQPLHRLTQADGIEMLLGNAFPIGVFVF